MAYGPGQAYPPYPGVNPAWLAGSADRERTVGVLRAGFTEGRLAQDELDDRIGRAYAARTYGDLWTLTADLPAGPLPYPGGLPAVPYQPGNPAVPADAEPATSWQSAAALVITALVIFTLAALVTAIATAHARPLSATSRARSSSRGCSPGPECPATALPAAAFTAAARSSAP